MLKTLLRKWLKVDEEIHKARKESYDKGYGDGFKAADWSIDDYTILVKAFLDKQTEMHKAPMRESEGWIIKFIENYRHDRSILEKIANEPK